MAIYDQYNEIGKVNIKTTRSDFTKLIGSDGTKDIIKNVLLGGNVRDTTEFITQRRLLNSYAATLSLFTENLGTLTNDIEAYTKFVTKDLLSSRGNAKILDLWLLGLTKKGLDNIVRTELNIKEYQESFSTSFSDCLDSITEEFGKLSGNLVLGDKELPVSWETLMLLNIAVGAQTLSIRGSSKSMNGKLFEKLVLGTLLSIIGFEYRATPPIVVCKEDRLFWLSNMDENERETDATLICNGIAISIDIGFIGRGNPEITLDKVTRFGAYKSIGGVDHTMSTIIIVDTVGQRSDLFNKAARVNGFVLQMKDKDWVLSFAKLLCDKFGIELLLAEIELDQLPDYIDQEIQKIKIEPFIL